MKYLAIIFILFLLTTTACAASYDTSYNQARSSSGMEEKPLPYETSDSGVENIFDDENEVAPPSVPED